jgi:hypothetical protein
LQELQEDRRDIFEGIKVEKGKKARVISAVQHSQREKSKK